MLDDRKLSGEDLIATEKTTRDGDDNDNDGETGMAS